MGLKLKPFRGYAWRLIVLFALLPSVSVVAAPRIACDDAVFDFGDVSSGDVSHAFSIANLGDEDLVIGNLRACCGGSMSIASKTIAPGSNTQVTVKLSLNHRNGQQRKSFYIASNDPVQPYFQLRFIGSVVPPVSLSPSGLSFGEVEADAVVKQQMQLICSADTVIQITNVVSSATTFAVSAEKAAEVTSHVITVRTVPPLSNGLTQANISIYTDNPAYPVFTAPVSAAVVGGLIAVPKELLLKEGAGGGVSRFVAIQSRDQSPFKITGVQLPGNGMKATVTALGPGAYRCEVINIHPLAELDGQQVRIITDHPTARIVAVPIRVVLSESPTNPVTRMSSVAETMAPAVPPVIIDYFYEEGCPDCQKIRNQVLPALKERFGSPTSEGSPSGAVDVFQPRYELSQSSSREGFYVLNYNDVGEMDVIRKLFAYQEKLGIKENEPVCMVVDYKYVFNGFASIQKGLLQQIDASVAARMAEGWVAPEPIREAANAAETLEIAKRRSQGFTLGLVAIAGLTDGINPCAIASLVFLMSMLRLSKNAGRGLLVMGATYCLAAFVTYIAIGFGLLRALHLLDQFETIQKGIEIVMLCLLGVLALLSFRDAYRFHAGANPDDITLQLPDKVKRLSHKIMREGLKTKNLILGGITIGVLVTGLETVCTGQVLVPTLVVVIREAGQSTRELAYLLLYNFMFILPLIVVFVLTYFGLTTEALMAWSRRNVVFSKVMLGCFFVAMGVLVVLL